MRYYSDVLCKMFNTVEELKLAEGMNEKRQREAAIEEKVFKETLSKYNVDIEKAEKEVEEAYEFYHGKIKEADKKVSDLYDEYQEKAVTIYNNLLEEGTPKLDAAEEKLRKLKESRLDFMGDIPTDEDEFDDDFEDDFEDEEEFDEEELREEIDKATKFLNVFLKNFK